MAAFLEILTSFGVARSDFTSGDNRALVETATSG